MSPTDKKEVSFDVKTLTPLFTGNVKGGTERLRGTGLMGSLRWWLEVIARGLGHDACNGGGTDDCACPVCEVFGRTGEAKKFKLRVDGDPKKIHEKPLNFTVGGNGWFVGPAAFLGDLKLRFVFRNPPETEMDIETYFFWPALALAERWGGLGAKTQLGFGVVKLPEPPTTVGGKGLEGIITKLGAGTRDASEFPDLRDFFFAKVTFTPPDPWNPRLVIPFNKKPRNETEVQRKEREEKDKKETEEWLKKWRIEKGYVPSAFSAKYALRYGNNKSSILHGVGDGESAVARALFGTTEDPARISRIHVSWAYPAYAEDGVAADGRWRFRVWGWLDKEWTQSDANRDGVLDSLKAILENKNGASGATTFWEKYLGFPEREPKPEMLDIDWREFWSQGTGGRDNSGVPYGKGPEGVVAFLKHLCGVSDKVVTR